MDGFYEKSKQLRNGFPVYNQKGIDGSAGEAQIWFCREWECNFNGWVVGRGRGYNTLTYGVFNNLCPINYIQSSASIGKLSLLL